MSTIEELAKRVEQLELLGPVGSSNETSDKALLEENEQLKAKVAKLEYRILTLLRSFDEIDDKKHLK